MITNLDVTVTSLTGWQTVEMPGLTLVQLILVHCLPKTLVVVNKPHKSECSVYHETYLHNVIYPVQYINVCSLTNVSYLFTQKVKLYIYLCRCMEFLTLFTHISYYDRDTSQLYFGEIWSCMNSMHVLIFSQPF